MVNSRSRKHSFYFQLHNPTQHMSTDAKRLHVKLFADIYYRGARDYNGQRCWRSTMFDVGLQQVESRRNTKSQGVFRNENEEIAQSLFAADWGEVIAYPKPPHLVQGDV